MKQVGTGLLITAAMAGAVTTATAATPAPRVTLTSPIAHATLGDSATLTAYAPGAYAVTFRGRWADADGIRRWHTLGTDRDASDGFALVWSAETVRTRAHVFVGAHALARGGKRLSTSRSVPLATKSDTAATTSGGVRAEGTTVDTVFKVVNTCGAGSCKLTRRATPEAAGRALGTLAEGTAVKIVCQTQGGTVSAKAGTSRIWDRLQDGSWVSDLYVDTTGKPGFTDGLPRCATR